MFDTERTINEFQVDVFEQIFADIGEDSLYRPGSGHGHPPVWIAGHLAITGEMGLQFLGGQLTHPDWSTLFGPGSSDQIAPSAGITKSQLHDAVVAAYAGLRDECRYADSTILESPHGIPFFQQTPLKTMHHVIAVLLTNHFGFHLAQLSSCRRESGGKALF